MNENIIIKYEKYLKNKKLNELTIRNYIYDIKVFDKFIDKDFLHVTEDDIKEYIQDKKMKGNSANKINFSISALSKLYKYLVNNHGIKENPMENISRIKNKKKKEEGYLTTFQIYEIRRKLTDLNDIQLELFFGLLCSGCPSKNSISKIEWRRISWKNKYIEVILDEKVRSIIFLDDYTLKKLDELRKERHKKGIKRKHVFLTRYNGNWRPICDATISYWLNKIKEIANVDKLTFGIMKNTMIHYNLMGRQMSEEKVKKILNCRQFENEFRSLVLEDIDEINSMKKGV